MTSKPRPECPDYFGTTFGRSLVEYLGGDISKIEDDDCWTQFAAKFPELRDKAMKYFEEAKTGEPSEAAFWMVLYCGAPLEWGMRVAENATTGDPSRAAYWMVKDCGAPEEWYEKIRKKHEK